MSMHNNNKFYLFKKNAKNTISKVKEKGKKERGKGKEKDEKGKGERSSNGIVTF